MAQPKRKLRQVQVRTGSNIFDWSPKITVIVTAGSAGGDAGETLDSAIKQKFREHEVIVAVGRSEASAELERAASGRLEDIILVKQRGGTEATVRFAALEHARGNVVAFLKTGDVWNPEFLASQLIQLERENVELVFCDAALAGTKSVYRRSFMELHPFAGPADFPNLLSGKCSILASSVLVRRESLDALPTDEIPVEADVDRLMWLELAARRTRMSGNRRRLLRYRESDETENPVDADARERATLAALVESPSITGSQRASIEMHLSRIESRLAEERGISLLRSGENAEALNCLRDAARYQPTLKLTAVTWLARVAPKAALYLADGGRAPQAPTAPPQYRN